MTAHPAPLLKPALRVYALLIAANIGAWAWALIAFRDDTVLLGTALIAYGFGLRHAVDADHIAAIDNVTRKLMQEGRRPLTVGLFFALGHSLVVCIVAAAVAVTTAALQGRFAMLRGIGGIVSTTASALFLLAIAGMNLVIFRSVYRTFRHVRNGGAYVDEDLDMLLAGRGLMARLFRPLFRLVTRSWHMLPIGFLFGLGFETATEISLLGLSSTEATHGVSVWAILVFPALFAAGMTLVDTTDGMMMLGAYNWAFTKPIRKLYYNMTITAVSVLVALLIAGIEALGLAADQWGLTDGPWRVIATLNDHFNGIGFAIIALFAASWCVSFAIYRAKGLDAIEVRTTGG